MGAFPRGVLETLAINLGLAASFLLLALMCDLPHAPPGLFRDIAQIGATLLVAFAVVIGGAAIFTGGDLRSHVNWLGYSCGHGLSMFLSIALGLALSAYRENHHAGWPDLAGLSWIVASLTLTGIAIAFSPLAIYTWNRDQAGD